MTLLPVVACFSFGIGGLGCSLLLHILVTMLMLPKPGLLSKRNVWLLHSVFLGFRHPDNICWSALSGCSSWFFTLYISEIIHRIVSLTGLRGCLGYPLLQLVNPMPLTQCLCTDSFLNGTTFCVLIQTFMIFYLLLSPLFANNFYLHWFPHPPSDLERELLSLPTSLGGLGICDLNYSSGANYKFSHELSRPLVDLILCQRDSLPHDVIDTQCLVFKQLSQAKHQCQVDTARSILSRSPPTLRRAIVLSGERCVFLALRSPD